MIRISLRGILLRNDWMVADGKLFLFGEERQREPGSFHLHV